VANMLSKDFEKFSC